MRWKEHVANMEEMMKAYKILVVKSAGKRVLARPRHGWEMAQMNFKDTGCQGVDWIKMARERVQ
jgi:hypothetical protein